MKYFASLPLLASLAAATEHLGGTVMMEAKPAEAAPAAGGQTHTVVVGGMKPVSTGMAAVLGYTPESITAAQGDKVQFVFMQKNHTVTQSTFDQPCKKMEGGMDSGFMPNPDGKEGVNFEMTVETTEPLWFYCRQNNGIHCGKGMVFAINAKTEGSNTFAAYKQLAIGQNGTGTLTTAAINQPAATPAAAPSTVTINAGGGGGAAATPAAGGNATAEGASPQASVAQGQGQTGNGEACSCQCLCGMNSFPANAAQNSFGGFAGEIV